MEEFGGYDGRPARLPWLEGDNPNWSLGFEILPEVYKSSLDLSELEGLQPVHLCLDLEPVAGIEKIVVKLFQTSTTTLKYFLNSVAVN